MTNRPIEGTETSQRVVVGVDGSPASLRALEWATDYASLQHLHVEVILAWPPYPQDFGPQTSAEQMLDYVVEQHRAQVPNLSIDGRVVQGDAAKVLESASDGAALLVVAQRGHGEIVGLLLGSVSGHCVTHAKCPVLVYRDAPLLASSGTNAGPPVTAGDHQDTTNRLLSSDSAACEELDQVMRDPGGI